MTISPGRDLESRWREWVADRNRRGMLIASVIVAVLYPMFGVLDYLFSPRPALPALFVTRSFVVLVTIVMFKGVHSKVFAQRHEAISSSYTVLCASGIALMTLFMGGLESPYYAGLTLAMIGSGLLFVWPARVVLATHAGIVACFVVPNLLLSHSPNTFESYCNVAFLISTAVITGTGQIVLHRLQREQIASRFALEQTKGNLEQANDKLKQLDRFKSQFFANITHEFKTPLAMILTPLEMILNGDMCDYGASEKATFESMFLSGMKLLKMIGDLLDLSKLEESRLRLRIAEQDLVPYLHYLIDQVQPLAQRKDIELSFDANAEQCLVHCDLEQLERVFINLLSNALKFTPRGGHVAVSLRDLGGNAWVVVKDDGPGFPADLADRLFERFFQVDGSETRRHGGTGIGLALAKDIVELHGGRIRAESDHGARFTVELIKDKEHFRPDALDRRSQRRDVVAGSRAGDRGVHEFAAQLQSREEFRLLDIVEATERRVIARDPEEDKRAHSCLVVEDTPDVIRLVGMAMRPHFKMLSAPDGIAGLELARRELPSLIVTDLMMPGMDGLELTRKLREDPATRHIPIIMLTARGEVEDRVAGIENGVNAFLAKPFSPRELVSAARNLVKMQAQTADILLTQKMDSLETIAGGLAHEINNPLNYLKNALVRVRLDTESLLAKKEMSAAELRKMETRFREMFQVAESGIKRIAGTVELMGNYSRAGYSRQVRPYDVFQAAREVVDLVLPATGRKVHVETCFVGEASVECVPEELNQVLTNLVQNAIEACPEEIGRVDVSGHVDGEILELRVKDNGHGIKPEDKQRIFTPFFTTKGPGRGMGMGLTIVWRVVASLGGTLSVESEPGEGTEFLLRLPLRAAAQRSAA
ncbi:MAG: ATP-binding protein [Myxococcales bacterium]